MKDKIYQKKSFKPNNKTHENNARKFMQINLLNITEKKFSLPETTTIGFLNWKKAHKLRRGLAASKLRACIVSGRSRGVYRRYGVARTQIRFLLDFGLLFGTRKSSW